MGGSAIAVAGLGLSAASTVNQIQQQKRQAEARKQRLETQNLLAEEQLKLSQEQFEMNKNLSRKQYEREQQLIDAQRKQAEQQLESQKLQQRVAMLQTQARAEQVEERAKQRAQKILGASERAETKNLQQQQAGQEQIQQLAEQQGQITEQQDIARAAERQQDAVDQAQSASLEGSVNPQAVAAQQDFGAAQRRFMENIDALEERRLAQSQFSQERADIAEEAGQQSSGFIREQAGFQERAFDIQNELNRQNINFGTKQNKQAAKAAFLANQASRNIKQTSRFIQTKSRIAQNLSKKSMVDEPGFLDVAAAGAQLAGQAVKTGLLGPDKPKSSEVEAFPNINSTANQNVSFAGTTSLPSFGASGGTQGGSPSQATGFLGSSSQTGTTTTNEQVFTKPGVEPTLGGG